MVKEIEKVMITKAVQDILRKNPNWMSAIANDLISPTKIARKILSEVAKEINRPINKIKLDSVVKAVKIYQKTIQIPEEGLSLVQEIM